MKTRLATALTAALLLSGCEDRIAWAPSADADQSERFIPISRGGGKFLNLGNGVVPVDPTLDPTEAEITREFIGKLVAAGSTQCPPPDPGEPYDVEPLFDLSTVPAFSELRRWCRYIPLAGATGAPPIANPAAVGINLGPSRVATVPHGVLTNLYDDDVTALFVQQADRAAGVLPPSGRVPRSRLVVLDTHPTQAPGTVTWQVAPSNPPGQRGPRYGHGYWLARMAKQLTCEPGGGCLGEIGTRLAMGKYVDPVTGDVRQDNQRGGAFGTIGDLARAIQAETADFFDTGLPGQRLILNLSLGWNPAYGGTDPNPALWPLDVQAVYDAVYDAACQGHLVFASSGNLSGGTHGDALGPVLPALWDARIASEVECQARLGSSESFQFIDGKSILYAVGGIDEGNHPISIARPDSTPRLVAYADHGMVRDPALSGGFTTPLTGTSVGAVVASASALGVWQNLPSLSPPDVVEVLSSAVTVPAAYPTPAVSPAMCPGGAGCGDASRVEVCESITYACEVNPATVGSCGQHAAPVTCAGGAPVVPDAPPPAIDAFKLAKPNVSLNPILTAVNTPAVCGPLRTVSSAHPWPVAYPCPTQQFYTDDQVQPFTVPQPHNTDCPYCYLAKGSGEIYLQVDPPANFGAVDAMTLTVDDGVGSVQSWTTTSVPPGTSVVFFINPALVASTVSAKIDITAGGDTYYAPLDVLP